MQNRHRTQIASGFLALSLAAIASTAAQAANRPEDWPVRIERESHDYVIDAEGRYVETVETATRVLKTSGIDYARDSSIGYSTSIQQADVLAAYTLKADGRRIDVPKGNFQVSSSRGREGDSPIYSDRTSLTVVFPELAVGDTTVLQYRLTAKEPMFPGAFSVIDSFDPTSYYGDVRISIDAPVSLKAAWAAPKLTVAEDTTRDGRHRLTWTWRNREPADPDTLQDALYDFERYPGYAFSTFGSYADISRAYGARAEAKAAVTPRIRALADKIAGDAKAPREVAQRLYDWVAKEIAYAGNCIGLGAVVPRDLDVVLDNRMGDCKDHATLLQALLRARGIANTQALVNASQVYTLPKIPVASMVNHVINYVPSLDLYLDSTSSQTPFGSLPDVVAGKRVLLVDGYRDDTVTPMPDRARDWTRMRTQVAIAADGSVKGTARVEIGGDMAIMARQQLKEAGETLRADMVKSYFRARGLIGDGSLRMSPDVAATAGTFAMEADFHAEGMLAVPSGFEVAPLLLGFRPIQSIVVSQLPDPGKPAGAGACGGTRSQESYVYDFAPGLKVVAIPPDFEASEGPVSYRASHRREGNRIVVERTLDDRTPGPTCTAEYNAAYGRLMKRVMDNLRAQVVFLRDAEPVR